MSLFRAIILAQDEEHELLGLLHSFHAVWTDAHNTSEELDALGRLKAGENRLANANGLDANKLSICYTRDRAGNWHANASYPLTDDEEERFRGVG